MLFVPFLQLLLLFEACVGAPPVIRPSRPWLVTRIPSGSSILGTKKAHFEADGEAPEYPFVLPADLYMDVYEVDNARFSSFSSSTGFVTDAEAFKWSFVHEQALSESTLAGVTNSVKGAEWWVPVTNATWSQPEGPGSSVLERADHPAVHISQRDAAAFCGWAGGRLPTESEWEYAARGGKRGRLFPWGSKLLVKGEHRTNIYQGNFPYNNTGEDGHPWTAPGDAFAAQNAWGLRHIVGNVWEWTSTVWCSKHAAVAAGGGAGAAAGGRRERPDAPDCRSMPKPKTPGDVDFVKKGGSFMCHIDHCYRYRVAARHRNTADSSAYNLGARCIYDALPAGAVLLDHPTVVSLKKEEEEDAGSAAAGEL